MGQRGNFKKENRKVTFCCFLFLKENENSKIRISLQLTKINGKKINKIFTVNRKKTQESQDVSIQI